MLKTCFFFLFLFFIYFYFVVVSVCHVHVFVLLLGIFPFAYCVRLSYRLSFSTKNINCRPVLYTYQVVVVVCAWLGRSSLSLSLCVFDSSFKRRAEELCGWCGFNFAWMDGASFPAVAL